MGKINRICLTLVTVMLFGSLHVLGDAIPNPDKRVGVAYRHLINGKEIGTANCDSKTQKEIEAEIELSQLRDDFMFPMVLEYYNRNDEADYVKDNFNFNYSYSGANYDLRIKGNFYYELQYLTAFGSWGVPYVKSVSFEETVTGKIIDMSIPAYSKIEVPDGLKVNVVRIFSDGRNFTAKTSSLSANMEIYDYNGTLVQKIMTYELYKGIDITLSAGWYYAVLYTLPEHKDDKYVYPTEYHLSLGAYDGKVPTPVIEEQNGEVSIECELQDATIYYYILESDEEPDIAMILEKGEKYTKPFYPNKNCEIAAVATYNNLDSSDIARFTVSSYAVPSPEIEDNGSIINIGGSNEGCSYYYCLSYDENYNSDSFVPFEEPFELDYNVNVFAIAKLQGWADSPVAMLGVKDRKTAIPTLIKFDKDERKLYLECASSDSTIYYRKQGLSVWETYSNYIDVRENGVIEAYASSPHRLDSDVIPFTISEFSCNPAIITYDGRYATIYIDDENPEGEIRYSSAKESVSGIATHGGKVDLEGLYELTAKVTREGYTDSEPVTFTPMYYANEMEVFTTSVGQFESVFEWLRESGSYSQGNGEESVEEMTVHGVMNGPDFDYIRNFKNLRILDLKELKGEKLPAGTLFGMDGLEYLVMPESLSVSDGNVFKDNSRLSAIRFTSPTETVMPSGLLNGIENPNLLLYVRFADYAKEVEDKFPNVILGVDNGEGVVVAGEAKSKIQLYDGYPFYCPIEFSAKEAEFTREFNKTTELFGGCAGWELMTLPFRAHGFNHAEKGSIYSFADNRIPSTNEYSRKFWLYYRGSTGPDFIPEWVGADSMEPNAPYLVAMPNNELYYDEYNLNGTVTFIGTGVFVPATPEEMSIDFGNGDRLVATYRPVAMTDRMMAINDEDYYSDGKNYLPGSCFLGKTFQSRDIRPFECYLLTEDANRRAMPIFDTSSVEKLFGDNDMKVWSEGHDIVILSAKKTSFSVYDMAGRCVRTATAVAGEETRLTDFAPGVYFIGGKKLLIK